MGIAPSHLQELFCYTHFGHGPKLTVPYFHSSYGQCSFSCAAPRLYNKLPMSIKSSNSLVKFKGAGGGGVFIKISLKSTF